MGRERMIQRFGCFAILLLSLALAGCDAGDERRVRVHGKVTRGGEDVSQATITFLPDQETSGPAAGSSVQNGSYDIDRDEGPAAGPYRVTVEVDATSPPTKTVGVADKNQSGTTERFDFRVTTRQAGPNEFNFELDEAE